MFGKETGARNQAISQCAFPQTQSPHDESEKERRATAAAVVAQQKRDQTRDEEGRDGEEDRSIGRLMGGTREEEEEAANNLKNTFRKKPIVLFRDLCLVRRSVKGWWVVVDILNIDDNRRVVLIQIVGSNQTQFVLSRETQRQQERRRTGQREWRGDITRRTSGGGEQGSAIRMTPDGKGC